jgi:hypothetical protein
MSHKMLICKAGIDFSSLKTSPSIPAHFEEEESIIASFFIPNPPPTLGIDSLGSMPWVLKSLKIRALVSFSSAASENWSFTGAASTAGLSCRLTG